MRRLSDRSARCRAVLAVAALYGFVLQAFLAAWVPLPAQAREHGSICAPLSDGGSDRSAPCPKLPCCLVAHLAQPLVAPDPLPAGLIVPWRHAEALVWRPLDLRSARGPPDRAVSSRGPPAA